MSASWSRRLERALAWAAGGALVAFVAHQAVTLQSAAEAGASPIHYPVPLHPARPVYRPGQLATFSGVQQARVAPLAVLTWEAFVEQRTRTHYPSVPSVLSVDRRGRETVRLARQLPAYLPPGFYRLEGAATAQTVRRTQAELYRSEVFEVRR